MDTRPSLSPDSDLASKPFRSKKRRIWIWLGLAGAAIVVLAWLGFKDQGLSPQQPSPGVELPQSVAVAGATKSDVPIRLNALGTVTSLATVTIKSQISGYLTKIVFREGQLVKKGDLLVEIDPRPYQVALAQYQGQLAKDIALLDNARLDLTRYRQLSKQNAISKQTTDTQEATVRQYEGTVAADQAQVDNQKLNLIYCQIISPIDGRVGLRQVDIGNYVTASDTSGIVVVTQIDPISVVFTLPEDNLTALMQRLRDGAQLSVTAYDRTNTTKLADGTLDTVDNQVDTSTGTVKLRAMFANAGSALFPNQFVNVQLLLNTLRDVITVPTAAVQTGIPGTFVYLVNSDSTVSVRTIQTIATADGRVAVLTGLSIGDRVVIDGIDHLHNGSIVTISTPNSASIQETETKTPNGGAKNASPQ